ncbi:adenosylcobinamide amidohydrolase [Sulfitobacter sp. PR48]|uniref:DUF6925 family protein n=1 Tax=Sulfitobacter sp. PR48 TaxID=3028383 RepID=UPI00237BE17E|nr:adenosylcobinamide amidohydrolase [Sulfitobacter sp. PR48]MDD9722446.1 adenosylcobinamide amidohydrolase [Sulfitobacter sp. PR48]
MSGVTLVRPWLSLELEREMQVLSWAINQPGFVTARRIVWREVRNADLPKERDVAAWLAQELEAQKMQDAVAFLTSRDVSRFTDQSAKAGRSLMDPDNPAMAAILRAHPHRVALTRLGRVEVFQMIGGPDTGGTSPEGPHTHVLPKLLRAGRTHSANAPIPEGWVPCAGYHPESPVSGRLGEDKAFNRAAFYRFQEMLQAWGSQEYLSAKSLCWAALEREREPGSITEPATRIGRAGLRNGLRQWRCLQGDCALLDRWSAAFDASTLPAETDDENPGH